MLTLLVRDEADVLDENLRFHLEHGVDFVVATDHRSTDGTTDILRRYERDGHLHLIREDGERREQSEWVTRMARLAATDFGADWVLNGDADEFWLGRDAPLRDLLAAVPMRYGVVLALWRHFVPRPETGESFFERMTVRRPPAAEGTSPFHAERKLAHRGDADVVVRKGNHDVVASRLLPLRDWFPLDVLHFPIRSVAQLERKYLTRQGELADPKSATLHVRALVDAIGTDGAEAVFRQLLVDDGALAAGLEDGRYTIDTRVRDALRAEPLEARHGRAGLVEEVAALRAIDAQARLDDRLAWLERRLAAVDASNPRSLLSRLRGVRDGG